MEENWRRAFFFFFSMMLASLCLSLVVFGHGGNYVILSAIFPPVPVPLSATVRAGAEWRGLPPVFSQHRAGWYLGGAQRNKWINKSRKAELDGVSQFFYAQQEAFIALFPWMDNHKKEMGKTVPGSRCSFPVWSQTQGPL